MPHRRSRSRRRDLVPASARFPSGEHHQRKSAAVAAPIVFVDDALDAVLAEPFEKPLAVVLAEASKKKGEPARPPAPKDERARRRRSG